MAEGGSGTIGRVSYWRAIKADIFIHRPLALDCFLWPWWKLHSSEPKEDEKSSCGRERDKRDDFPPVTKLFKCKNGWEQVTNFSGRLYPSTSKALLLRLVLHLLLPGLPLSSLILKKTLLGPWLWCLRVLGLRHWRSTASRGKRVELKKRCRTRET